jgi:glutathione S-transferase
MLVPWLYSRGASELTIDIEKDFPAYNAWQQRMMARPAVVKVINDRRSAMAQVGMVPN